LLDMALSSPTAWSDALSTVIFVVRHRAEVGCRGRMQG
jgi:hypothetical protein